MKMVESEHIEFKRAFTADLKKEVVAFANSHGGTIYIGIRDDGTISGLADANKVALQALNMIRDAIKPDVTMFTHCTVEHMDDQEVVVIHVQRGTARPYYIVEKGLRPTGVYVRQGTASAPASESAIRQMIKESDDGDHFEDARSLNQDLTFEDTEKEFRKRNLPFHDFQVKTLGIVNTDHIYTNLGLLLSDQCTHTTKAAVFMGDNKQDFIDRREFGGSLLKQLAGVYEFIDMYNKTNAEFNGLERIDHREYPEAAIREALLNALVHRDYAYSGSTLIHIYRNKIEFISIGGLVPGITLNDIMLGVSQARNAKLAAIFYRLRLIEAYGTGISKIMDSYQTERIKPELTTSDHAFRIVLPNMNHAKKKVPSPSKEQMILNHLKGHHQITRREVETLLGIGQTAAGRILRKLVETKRIHAKREGKNTVYQLVDR